MKAKSVAALFFLWFAGGRMAIGPVEAQQAGLPPEVLHYADTIFYNGKILTADAQFSVAEAVAVRDGRFLAIGPTARILSMAGPNTRRIDLKGKMVTPAIYDMHMDEFGFAPMLHWAQKFLGENPRDMMDSYETGWKSKEEAAEGIKRATTKVKPGEPVMMPRVQLKVKRDSGQAGFICEVFTLAEMDAIAPNNPVFFVSVVNTVPLATNSRGAEVIKRFLPKGVSSPFPKENNICLRVGGGGGGQVDGILTPGQFAAADYVFWYEPPDHMLEAYREIQRRQNDKGVVMGRGHMGVPLFNGVHALWERHELTLRFRMPFPLVPQISGHATQPADPEEAETLFRRWANMSKIGDNMLRVTGMRIPAVGGNQNSGNTWMLEPKIRPFPDDYGRPAPYGGGFYEQEAMEKGLRESFRGREALIQACRFGWDTATDHTVGDRAYHEVIKAYEECLKDQVVKRPTQRLTTGHSPMSAPEDIALAAKMGIWSNISIGHAIGTEIESSVLQYGTERVNKFAPVKTFINMGIHPSIEGTFWNAPEKSAFFFLSKYITRKDEKYQRAWNPSEALTRQEALWAASIWGAEQLNEHDQMGNIMGGKEADLIVIDKDYMTIPQDDIENIKVLLTMVGGKVVYEVTGAL